MKFNFFLILVFICACNNNQAVSIASNEENCHFNISKWRKEVFDIDSLQFFPAIDIGVRKEISFLDSPEIRVVHPKITLTSNTSASEVSALFPESSKLVIVNGNLWSGHMEVFVTTHDFDSRRWFFVFKGEMLTHLILYDFPW